MSLRVCSCVSTHVHLGVGIVGFVLEVHAFLCICRSPPGISLNISVFVGSSPQQLLEHWRQSSVRAYAQARAIDHAIDHLFATPKTRAVAIKRFRFIE